jgi:hypothetical protein
LKSLNAFSERGENKDVDDTAFLLKEYVLDRTVRREHLMATSQQLAVIEHQYSIQESAENAKRHEALIARGLEGVQSYEQAGITPDQIANLIRAAQAAELSFIAAGSF